MHKVQTIRLWYIAVGDNTLKFCSTQILASLQTEVPVHPTSTRHCQRLEIVVPSRLVICILNTFQLFQSVGKMSRITNKKYKLAQDKLGALFEQLQ